ncbi:MAG: DUF29 domain-containing protein [Cyanobacterium sp. T60_A2020_053]|nr:DUF29 domain-containing protein [Cyanobacterium sp. T60_A2020_053]
MTVADKLSQLYELDDYQWLEENIKLLKAKMFHEIDLENLIEELEDLGKERKNAVESLLQQIIRHLLMYQYWHDERERNANHWEGEIYSFRDQLNHKLTTNLHNHLISKLDNIYDRALGYVIRKTCLSINIFPTNCPYTLAQLLDIDYLP